MVIFVAKKFNYDLLLGEVPGTFYGMFENGRMDQELFSKWFIMHFLQHSVSAQPLFLLLDGHSSHYTMELVEEAAKQDVIIFCFPPHTTAYTQPLDISVFGPLKVHWSEACHEYLYAHPDQAVTKFQFSTLFHQTCSKAMTIENMFWF